jgi:hypothetical protein
MRVITTPNTTPVSTRRVFSRALSFDSSPRSTKDLNAHRSLLTSALCLSTLLAGCGGGGVQSALPRMAASGNALSTSAAARSAATSSTAPSVAQTAFAGSNGAATSLAAQLAAAPAAGSYLVAIVGSGDAATTTTPPAGWSAAKDAAGHACRTSGTTDTQGEQVFVHQVAAGESAGPYAFSFSTKNMYAIGVMELRNVSASAPIDACGVTTATNASGAIAAAKVTAAAANELPVVAYAPSTSGLTASPGTGWTSKTYNATQTKWMTLDAEYGPPTAAAGSVTPSTTFGSAKIVYVPSVTLLFAPGATPGPGPSTVPAAPPAVAQTALAGSNGAATSVAAQLPSAPTAGSYLVGLIGTGDAATTTTPPAGWTAAQDAAGNACRTTGASDTQGEQVFVHRVAAGEGAGPYSFSFSTSNMYALSVLEVRNASAIDACGATTATNASATVAAPKVTAAAAGELPVVGYAPSTSGLTPQPGAGWTTKTYNAAQTQWMTLDAEYGPLTAAAGSVAPSTTFANAGGSTIVYAPSITLLFAPASANPGPGPSNAPTPVPTAVPTSLPTVVPTTAPTTAPGTLQNGVEWPASFRPYGATSYWNRPMTNTTSPALLASSAQMISTAYANGDADANMLRLPSNGGSNNQGHPIVFASTSDPVVTLNCTLYCGTKPPFTRIHIPAGAEPGDGSDAHLAIVQPTDAALGTTNGDEVDTWMMRNNGGSWPAGGGTLSANTITYCGNFYNGSGYNAGGTAVVGGGCLGGGIVTKSQLVDAGVIPHALFLMQQCGAASYVFPAGQNFDTICTGGGPSIPNGAHIWLDQNGYSIAALPISAAEKTLLTAMNNYGGYIMDSYGQTGSRATGVMALDNTFENAQQFQAFNASAPLNAWALSSGWNGVTIGSSTWPTLADPWTPLSSVGGWAAHLHVVDPCYAQGTC